MRLRSRPSMPAALRSSSRNPTCARPTIRSSRGAASASPRTRTCACSGATTTRRASSTRCRVTGRRRAAAPRLTMTKNPDWIGRDHRASRSISPRTARRTRARRRRRSRKPVGAVDVLRDRSARMAAFERWSGTSINTITGGADVQELPLPTLLRRRGRIALARGSRWPGAGAGLCARSSSRWLGAAVRAGVAAARCCVDGEPFRARSSETREQYGGKDWRDAPSCGRGRRSSRSSRRSRAKCAGHAGRIFVAAGRALFPRSRRLSPLSAQRATSTRRRSLPPASDDARGRLARRLPAPGMQYDRDAADAAAGKAARRTRPNLLIEPGRRACSSCSSDGSLPRISPAGSSCGRSASRCCALRAHAVAPTRRRHARGSPAQVSWPARSLLTLMDARRCRRWARRSRSCRSVLALLVAAMPAVRGARDGGENARHPHARALREGARIAPSDTPAKLAWALLLAWLAVRFAMLLAPRSLRQPLYPWDAWTQWATKARVWYLAAAHRAVRAAPTHGSRRTAARYFDASPHYPATVPLWQVWTQRRARPLGRRAHELPWWSCGVALALVAVRRAAPRSATPRAGRARRRRGSSSSLPLAERARRARRLRGPADGRLSTPPRRSPRCAGSSDADRRRRAARARLRRRAARLIKNPGSIWVAVLLAGPWSSRAWPRADLRLVVAAGRGRRARVRPRPLRARRCSATTVHLSLNRPWHGAARRLPQLANWHLLWYAVLPPWRPRTGREAVAPRPRAAHDAGRLGRAVPARRFGVTNARDLGRGPDDGQPRGAAPCAAVAVWLSARAARPGVRRRTCRDAGVTRDVAVGAQPAQRRAGNPAGDAAGVAAVVTHPADGPRMLDLPQRHAALPPTRPTTRSRCAPSSARRPASASRARCCSPTRRPRRSRCPPASTSCASRRCARATTIRG